MHFNQDLQAVVKGVVVISDNKGVDAALMKSLTPALAKKCIVIFQVVYLNKTMIYGDPLAIFLKQQLIHRMAIPRIQRRITWSTFPPSWRSSPSSC